MRNVYRFRRLKHGAPERLQSGLPGVGPTRRTRSRGDLLPTIGIMAAAFVATAFMTSLLLEETGLPSFSPAAAVSGQDVERARFTYCVRGAGTNCIIDGDTFRYRGDIIRIADIDTPEVRNYGCAAEKTRGDAATRRLLALLNAGPFTLGAYPRDRDQYGRLLRIITRDGRSLGMTLVAEGLARKWDGARRGWC